MFFPQAALATLLALTLILPPPAQAGDLGGGVKPYPAVRDHRPTKVRCRSKRVAETVPVTPIPVEGGMTLALAVSIAADNNYGVRIKETAVSTARIDVHDVIRRTLPNLDLSIAKTRLNEAGSMKIGGGSIATSSATPESIRLDSAWPVYQFGKLSNAKSAARSGVAAKEEDLGYELVSNAFQVKQAFYGILLAERFVAIAERSLEQIDAHVKTVKSQFDVGMASKFDLLRIEVQRANTRPQLIRANLALKNAKDGFNMLLGRPIETPFEVTGELSAAGTRPIDLERLTATALAGRQDLKRAQKELEAARFAFQEARRGRNPNFTLTSDYSRVRGQNANSLNNWDESWNANAVFSLPILDRRETASAVRKAGENVKRAEIQAELIANQVRLDVKQAVNELIQSSELLVASSKNIEQAEEALGIADVSYESGINTNLEVMDAQVAVDQARTNFSQANYDWLIARAKLDKACGSLGAM